jgi:hypothetical protein
MAQQTINNGDTGLVARTAINDNFTELYAASIIPQYFVYGSGGTYGRIGIRGGATVRDQTITALGFAGVQGVDWDNIDTQSL